MEAIIIEEPLHSKKHHTKEEALEFPMRNIFQFEEITFDSNFESGNLMLAERVAPLSYNLYITPDCYKTSYENHFAVFFNFKVSHFHFADHHTTHTVSFTIKNLNTNQKKNIKEGMRPVFRTLTSDWDYVPYPIENAHFRDKSIEFTFKYDIHKDDKELFFAFTVPYTLSYLNNFIDYLELGFKAIPEAYFHREIVNYSLEGRQIELLTITGSHKKESTHEALIPYLFPEAKEGADLSKHRPIAFQKPYVFITGRVHPAEAPGSFIVQGFLKSLLNYNTSPDIKALLDHYVFVVLPMINPDGVVRGHYRSDTKGRDLNRVYDKLKPSEHPGCYAVMEVAKQLSKDKRLHIFLDTHAHSNEDAAFVFGNYTENVDHKLEIRTFARLFDIHGKTFDYHSCSFGSKPNPEVIDPEKIGVGKTEVGKATGVHMCFTCESSYHKGTKEKGRYAIGNEPKEGVDVIHPQVVYELKVADFEEVGHSLAHALVDLVGKHSTSIVKESYFGSLEGLKEWVKQELGGKKKPVKKTKVKHEGDIEEEETGYCK